MEEFYYAGGLPGVIRRMGEGNLLPHKDALTVNGKTCGRTARRADLRRRSDPPLDKPLIEGRRHLHPARQPGAARRRAQAVGRIAAPDAAPRPAVVFEDFEHYKSRIIDPDLDVDETRSW
jgi:L-arabonate dehydrase